MVRWLGFGVRLEEAVQDVQQGQDMLPVAAELCLPDIIGDHVPDFFGSVLLAQKVVSESRRRDFGQVFVFGDGKHLFFGQAAECDTIFQRDHARARILKTITVAPLQCAGECQRFSFRSSASPFVSISVPKNSWPILKQDFCQAGSMNRMMEQVTFDHRAVMG
jgi:hypothetical protein